MAERLPGPDLLTAPEAAGRLGVKRETLYAYVSRGLLRSYPSPTGGRGRRFDADEVERLRARAGDRRATRAGHALEIASSVTTISAGHLVLRGRDVADLAGHARFEEVAELLWAVADESPPAPEATAAWAAPPEVARAAAALVAALPPGVAPSDRLRAVVVGAAAADPLRSDLRPDAVAGTGRGLLVTLAALAGPAAPLLPRRPAAYVADLLAGSLGIDPTWAPVLDVVLVCLADHELATSTLAARVAASTRADPYACVLAGLAAVSGPLHGSASQGVVELLAEVAGGIAPARAVAARLRGPSRLPGFGHPLYPDGDPRARIVLAALRAGVVDEVGWAVVDDVLAAASSRAPVAPNVDFGIGALVFLAGLAADTGEAVFGLARVAGWLAHVIEEYEAPPLRYRVTSISGDRPSRPFLHAT